MSIRIRGVQGSLATRLMEGAVQSLTITNIARDHRIAEDIRLMMMSHLFETYGFRALDFAGNLWTTLEKIVEVHPYVKAAP